MDTNTSHKVVKGDTLSTLAKKYNTTITDLKRVNNLTSDVIKIGQILKLPPPKVTIQPTTTPKLKFPFVIAKSENFLFGADSKHSKGKKLPAKFFTRNDKIYQQSKEELHKELVALMQYGSVWSYEDVAVDIANKFLTNTSYSLNNTYSNQFLENAVRHSTEFQDYKNKITNELRKSIIANDNNILQNKIILSEKLTGRFHFQKSKDNYWKTGLIITLDQISYIEIELNNIEYKNNKPYKLNTTFILYDTYGLDDIDLDKYGSLRIDNQEVKEKEIFFKLLDEVTQTKREYRNWKKQSLSDIFGYKFNCWWVLQYYHNCVPLLIKLRIENVEIIL